MVATERSPLFQTLAKRSANFNVCTGSSLVVVLTILGLYVALQKSHSHGLPLLRTYDPSSGAFTANGASLYWGNAESELSPCVAGWILKFIEAQGYQSLADYGAGLGGFAMHFKKNGVADVHCYDGNAEIVESSHGLCQQVDLGLEQPHLSKVDLTMSLEVGEHIPAKHETTFLTNLCTASKQAIVLSWALPGQGGTGHVNEQSSEYIIGQVENLGFGFKLDRNHTEDLRRAAAQCPKHWYFMHDTLVFLKA